MKEDAEKRGSGVIHRVSKKPSKLWFVTTLSVVNRFVLWMYIKVISI